jgi:hypothetical protein
MSSTGPSTTQPVPARSAKRDRSGARRCRTPRTKPGRHGAERYLGDRGPQGGIGLTLGGFVGFGSSGPQPEMALARPRASALSMISAKCRRNSTAAAKLAACLLGGADGGGGFLGDDEHVLVSVRELCESLESLSPGGLNPLTLL